VPQQATGRRLDGPEDEYALSRGLRAVASLPHLQHLAAGINDLRTQQQHSCRLTALIAPQILFKALALSKGMSASLTHEAAHEKRTSTISNFVTVS
jgi:hypothetical protein